MPGPGRAPWPPDAITTSSGHSGSGHLTVRGPGILADPAPRGGLRSLARPVVCGLGREDTGEMNRDRAEVYLRLLAEEELRRVVAWCSAGAAGSWPVDDAV